MEDVKELRRQKETKRMNRQVREIVVKLKSLRGLNYIPKVELYNQCKQNLETLQKEYAELYGSASTKEPLGVSIVDAFKLLYENTPSQYIEDDLFKSVE